MTYRNTDETLLSVESFHKNWNDIVSKLIIGHDLNQESFRLSRIVENQSFARGNKAPIIVGKYVEYYISKDEKIIGLLCGFLANNKSYSEIYSYPN